MLTEEDCTNDSAWRAWNDLIAESCRTYWPPLLFPNWTGEEGVHPMKGFVAACLIWNPNLADPESWIPPMGVVPQVAMYDLDRESQKPGARYWSMRHEILRDRLYALLDAQVTITRDDIERIDQETKDEAIQFLDTIREERPPHPDNPNLLGPPWATGDPVGWLPLVPGIRSTDLVNLWNEVGPFLALFDLDTHLKDAAHVMHDAGVTQKEIAGRLGFVPSTIHTWLGRRAH